MISFPPLSFKYQNVFSYYNKHDSGPSVGIVQIVLDQEKNRLFLIDERFILKCFDIGGILKKLDNSTKKGFLQHIPSFNNDEFKWIFSVKAHREHILSLELIVKLLILEFRRPTHHHLLRQESQIVVCKNWKIRRLFHAELRKDSASSRRTQENRD